MTFTLTPSAPAEGYGEALLSLGDAKAWLRLDDGSDEDALIEALRDAAIEAVERTTNVRLAPTTGVARFDGFGPRMRIGIGPAATLAVTAIGYADASGAAAAIDDGAWRIDAAGNLLPASGAAWPCGGDVTVAFSVGYPEGACPPALIHAAKMFLAHLYRNREAVGAAALAELPLGFMMLCERFRMPVL